MEPSSSAPQAVQIEAETNDRTRYVEELTGEGDYWLSITDAARVCRVQDVSIRRAIARGALPVRRQRAGQNKRTRLVRASDLPGAGFPIIDESATITTEIGKADILSIPRQQQRILQDHQQFTARLAEMQQALASSQALLLANLQRQQEEFQAHLQTLREEQVRQLAATETRLLQQQESLQQRLSSLEESMEQKMLETREDIAHLQEEASRREAGLRAAIQAQQASFAAYREEVQQSLSDLEARQQERLEAYQQKVLDRFRQVEQEMQAQLSRLEQKTTDTLERHAQAFAGRFTDLMEQLSQFRQISERLSQATSEREREQERILEQKQQQLDRLAQLLPLLPYAGRRLLTEQDEATWSQALAALERTIVAGLQQQLAQYQPLLTLLSSEHLETLAQMLAERQ